VVDNPGNAKGVRSNSQTCRQGDTTCDYDADPAQCTFQVRACFDNQDVELPACSPMAVSTYQLRHPTPGAQRPSDRAAATAILDGRAGGVGARGQVPHSAQRGRPIRGSEGQRPYEAQVWPTLMAAQLSRRSAFAP
jgi:hypothetical protein